MSANILVIGDVMLDKYLIGNVHRISPEAPVPIVNITNEKTTLGGSANVAFNLKCLGVNSYSFGVVGIDSDSTEIDTLLKEKKIGDLLFRTNTISTTVKTRIIGEKQQIVRLDREDFFRLNDSLLNHLDNVITKHIFNTIIISDYNKGVCSSDICTYTIKYARENNIKIIVDPKGNDWEKYRGAYIVTPNLKEFQEITQIKIDNNDDHEIVKIGKGILDRYDFQNLLVTRSEKGMSLISVEDGAIHFPAKAQKIYDVSGAGDTVVSTIGVGLSYGLSLKKSIEIANIAAGIVVGKLGTAPIMLEELSEYMIENHEQLPL